MIEITDLTKHYGDAAVLDGVDLRVERGQILAVVGPSGAGKSTLARCINLLEVPSAGSIVVDGRDVTRLRRAELRQARRQIGTVFQSAGLLRRLTAAQNVALPLRHAGIPLDEQRTRVHELLERVGMLHRAGHHPAELSGGQRQRIGLARGLALRPAVLLADEPTSGLDPGATEGILSLLAELRADLGVTVVLITHEMDVVRRVADRVARLDHGRIVEEGPVAEVVLRDGSELARALVPAPAPERRPAGQQLFEVRYTDEHVPSAWPALVGRALGTDLALVAGLVEQVGGIDAGRLTIGVDEAVPAERVVATFAHHGLTARPLAVDLAGAGSAAAAAAGSDPASSSATDPADPASSSAAAPADAPAPARQEVAA